MNHKIAFLLGLGLMANLATAQVTLEYKVQEKSKAAFVTEIKMRQVLQIAGQEIPTRVAQQITGEVAAVTRAKDGALRVKTSIKGITAKFEFPGDLKMEFDSKVPDRKAPQQELEFILEGLRVISKTAITQVFDKDDQLKKVEIPDGATDGLNPLMKDELDPKKMREQMATLIARLPDKAVSKGDTWVRDEKASLGGGQVMTFRIDYKYEGIIKQGGRELDRITGKVTSVNYAQEGKAIGPLQVVDSELKPVHSAIELLFDRKFGRYVSEKGKFQVKGDMTFEVNGMKLPGKLDLTMEQNTKTTPQEKK
jgi:hypothetical protein